MLVIVLFVGICLAAVIEKMDISIPWFMMAFATTSWSFGVVFPTLDSFSASVSILATASLICVGLFPPSGCESWIPTILNDSIDISRCVMIHSIAAAVHTCTIIYAQFLVYESRTPFIWCRTWPFVLCRSWCRTRCRTWWTDAAVNRDDMILLSDRQRQDQLFQQLHPRNEALDLPAALYIRVFRIFRYDPPWWIVIEIIFTVLHWGCKILDLILSNNVSMQWLSLTFEILLFITLALSFTSIEMRSLHSSGEAEWA